MLVAFFSLTSCDSSEVDQDTDEVYTQNFTTNFKDAKMVGDDLYINFTIYNKSGDNLKNVTLGSVSVKDASGRSYYPYFSVDGSQSQSYANFASWKSGKTKSFVLVVEDYNINNGKEVQVSYNFSVPDFEGFSTTVNKTGLKVSDNRVKSNGVQTNDPNIDYAVTECYNQTNADGQVETYMTFEISPSADFSDVRISTQYESFVCNGESFYPREVSVNGRGFTDGSVELDLEKGKKSTITYRFVNNSGNAPTVEFDKGFLVMQSDQSFIVGDRINFFNIKISNK